MDLALETLQSEPTKKSNNYLTKNEMLDHNVNYAGEQPINPSTF